MAKVVHRGMVARPIRYCIGLRVTRRRWIVSRR